MLGLMLVKVRRVLEMQLIEVQRTASYVGVRWVDMGGTLQSYDLDMMPLSSLISDTSMTYQHN